MLRAIFLRLLDGEFPEVEDGRGERGIRLAEGKGFKDVLERACAA